MTVTRFTKCKGGIIIAFCSTELLAKLKYGMSNSFNAQVCVFVCVHVSKLPLLYTNINLQP